MGGNSKVAEKEEIINIAEGLWRETLNANSYYSIIKQYRDNYKEYENEIIMSSAFYSVTYLAIQNALFLELSKLYDRSKGAISLGHLVKLCGVSNCLPEYRKFETNDGRTLNIPYSHRIKNGEEWYFKDYIESQKQIQDLLGGQNKADISKEMTASEYIDFLGKQYNSLNSITERLIIQRNKIYAHNDVSLRLNVKDILKQYPLHYSDIEILIDYAFDVTRFIIGALTGIEKATSYVNINDWNGTLNYVKIGLKYRDKEIEEQTLKFTDENFPENYNRNS